MQKTCKKNTQKVQPQKPLPRNAKKTIKHAKNMQLLDFFCKTCTVPEFAFFFRIFCIFLEFLQCFELWSSNRSALPKMQKMHNSRICIFFAFIVFFFYFYFCIFLEVFCKKCTIPEFAFLSHFFTCFSYFYRFFFCIFLVFSSSFLKFFNF